MKIVIVGGNGLTGKKLVTHLSQQGHAVVVASRSTGVDTKTGKGLAEAMAGAQVVVDVTNPPSFEDSFVLEFFETSTRNQLAAAAAAGVGHHVALSVVGTDRLLRSGYFRGKMAQENLIKASGVPYTIVRATQFFEFLGGIADATTMNGVIRLPAALMQPVLLDEVVSVVAGVAVSRPHQGLVHLAGPEAKPMRAFVEEFLTFTHDSRQLIVDNEALYFGTTLEEHSLLPAGGARTGTTTFREWLHRSATHI